MPKLILLNGPLGAGKSTLAKRYGEDHPLTLVLDIDDVWATISHWRENNDVSTVLAKSLALTMARTYLDAGHDVIVPQIVQSAELATKFEDIAKELSAEYFEILLEVEKTEAIERYKERNKRSGHPTGFRAGGVVDTNGKEKKLTNMHNRMSEVADSRPQTIRVKSIPNDIEGTYAELLSKITR